MNFFQEITIRSDPEIGLYFIWKKVFQQLHLAFVEVKDQKDQIPVGISIPGYDDEKTGLGDKIRVFAETEQILQSLCLDKWLSALSEYASVSPARSVPKALVKSYAVFKRWRGNTNMERLARRRAKRCNETFEQAVIHYSDLKEERVKYPYVLAKSLSGDRDFRLIIKCEIVDEQFFGSFNCYGLSQDNATVPVW